MPYAPLPEQTVNRLKTFGRVMRVLTIIGILISLPFILVAGMGLATAVPLSVFLYAHSKYQHALNAGSQLTRRIYQLYVASALLSGVAIALCFYVLWELSHGIDTETQPFLPYLLMTIVVVPLITYFTILGAYKWNRQFR